MSVIVNRCVGCCVTGVLLLGTTFPAWATSEQSGASISLGYRTDTLDWNINGAGNFPGSEPNVLSELEWRDMDILQLKGELAGSNAKGFYFHGYADYGWSFGGQNQDSDYAGDNRTLEFSRSLNDVDGSKVFDISGGLGYTLFAGEFAQYRIIPLVGYSYHSQQLRMRNGNQQLWDSANAAVYDPTLVGSVPLGPFSGLNSSYDAEWYGPWLGADVLLDLQEDGTVFMRLEHHFVDYMARANWNLRTDFAHPVSFEHEANGRGWVLELGWRKPPSRYRWVWGASLVLQDWTTGAGIARSYLVDPTPPCSGNCYVEGRLNGVNWSSSSINLILRKEFSE